MSRTNPLAYDLKPFDVPRDMRSAAHLKCAYCPTVGKVIIAGFGNNPEKIQQYFIRLGWSCNVHNASQNFCPTCVKERRIRAQEEAEKRKAAVPGLLDAQKVQALNPPKEVPVKDSSPRGVQIGLKALTPEQKAALRQELDSTFDDSIGRYLEGNSDHKISEKLGIPRATVEDFRENAYGPLRDDPEIEEFRRQLDDLKKFIENLQSTAAKMESKLNEIARKVGL